MRTGENSYVNRCNPFLEQLCSDCSLIGKRMVGIDVDELKYMYAQSAQPIDLDYHLLQLAKNEGVRAARIYLINKFCEFETLFYQKEIGRLLSRDEYKARVLSLEVGLEGNEIQTPFWFV